MKKVLIAYATWAGSTREIAERIGSVFEQHDFEVSIRSTKTKIDAAEFDVIIAGSSIHAGRTISSFNKFLHHNKGLFSFKPVAIFVSCANMMNDNAETQAETAAWLNRTISKFPNLNPVSIGLFAGAAVTQGADFEKLNFFVKKIITAMQTSIKSDYGKSDFRDWDKIENWAEDLVQNVK